MFIRQKQNYPYISYNKFSKVHVQGSSWNIQIDIQVEMVKNQAELTRVSKKLIIKLDKFHKKKQYYAH